MMITLNGRLIDCGEALTIEDLLLHQNIAAAAIVVEQKDRKSTL